MRMALACARACSGAESSRQRKGKCTDAKNHTKPRKRARQACLPGIAQLPGRHALISEAVADKLSDTRSPQGLFCIFPRRVQTLCGLGRGGRYLCMEHVQDPANVGALLRSAAAFG